MFVLLVATEVYGTKMNMELLFPGRPSLHELRTNTEAIYGIEATLRRPDGHPVFPFKAVHFQVYDSVMRRWVDLVSCTQLLPWSQLYVFQRESYWHTDTPGPIPQPMHGQQRLSMSAPEYSRVEKVFKVLDSDNDGIAYFTDFVRAFHKTFHFDFSETTTRDFFMKADSDNDGRVTLSDFTNFCVTYPQMLDTMFFKIADPEQRADMLLASPSGAGGSIPYLPKRTVEEIREASFALEKERNKADELRKELAMAQGHVMQLENDVKSMASLAVKTESVHSRHLVDLQRTDQALESELTAIRSKYKELENMERDLLKRRRSLHGNVYFA